MNEGVPLDDETTISSISPPLHPEAEKLARRLSVWLWRLEGDNGGFGFCHIEFAKCVIKRLEMTDTYIAADFVA